MIQAVLGELAPKEEAMETQGAAEEEKCSSSMPGQENTETRKPFLKQTIEVLSEHAEGSSV